MTKLNQILRLSKAVPVFPVKVYKKKGKNVKIPMVKGGFKAATHDPYQIMRWFGEDGSFPDAQVGMPTGQASGLWVLDLDEKPEGSGHETMLEHPSLPDTISQTTVSGGTHMFFKYPEDRVVPSGQNVVGPFVDVRGEGGYVVVSPSEGYEMDGDLWHEAADAPAWLLDLVKKKTKKQEKKVTKSSKKPFTEDQVKAHLAKHPIHEYRHRDAWLTTMMAVKSGCHGNDYGLEAFIEWSMQDADHFDDDIDEVCRKEWESIEIEREGGVTGGTLVHQARVHDIEARKETAFEGFTSLDTADKDELEAWTFQQNGVLAKVEGNLYSMLCCKKIRRTEHGQMHENPLYKLIGYDELAEAPVFLREPPWGTKKGVYTHKLVSDSDLHHMMVWIHKMYDVSFGYAKMKDSIPAISMAHAFHPVVDYLESLKWDGVPRVETWIYDYLGTALPKDDIYLRAVSKKVLVGAVARAYRPGCKNDTMMILESTVQGVGKSTAVEILGGPWFRRPQFDIGHKDAEQNLIGSWINEWAELSDMNKRETQALKNYISAEQSTFRKSFGRLTETTRRTSIIIGTTNPDKGINEYLKDRTGNRRYWPVEVVGKVKNPKNGKWRMDKPAFERDRDQLWAEALQMYKGGEIWYLEDEEVTHAEREQKKRQAKDGREGVLIEWLYTGDYAQETHLSTYDVATLCFGLSPDKAKDFALREYAGLMAAIGWDKKNTKHPKTKAKGVFWVRPDNWDPYEEYEEDELE